VTASKLGYRQRSSFVFGDSGNIPFVDLPDTIAVVAANSAQSTAKDLLSIELIQTTEFRFLSELAMDDRKGALALFPISFAYRFLYACKCLELTAPEQEELYLNCEISLGRLLSVDDPQKFLVVCRKAYALLLLDLQSAEQGSVQAQKQMIGTPVRFGFTNDLVRFAFQCALGPQEAQQLENSITATHVVTLLNMAAATVGGTQISAYLESGLKFRWSTKPA
jgi:hypothetical protein